MTTREQQSLWEREQRRRGTLVQLGIEPLVSRFNPEGARPHRHLQPLHPPAGRMMPAIRRESFPDAPVTRRSCVI